MSVLNALASLVTDPYAGALKHREQAHAAVAAARAAHADGSAAAAARAKDVEEFPQIKPNDWSRAQDEGERGVAVTEITALEADAKVDAACPRAQALRDRFRAVRKVLADPRSDDSLREQLEHIDALAAAGVDVGNMAHVRACVAVSDSLAAIAADLAALSAERAAANLPSPHLFKAADASASPTLMRLGVRHSGPVLESLRQAAAAATLTVEMLDAAIELLGTMPANTERQRQTLHKLDARAAHWRQARETEAKASAVQRGQYGEVTGARARLGL